MLRRNHQLRKIVSEKKDDNSICDTSEMIDVEVLQIGEKYAQKAKKAS